MWNDWIAPGVSVTGAVFVVVRMASFHGGVLQRVSTLEKRADDTENEVKTVVSAVSKVAVIETKVDGLDRLVTSQLDEIKHTLRRLEGRSFDPGAPMDRRQSAAT